MMKILARMHVLVRGVTHQKEAGVDIEDAHSFRRRKLVRFYLASPRNRTRPGGSELLVQYLYWISSQTLRNALGDNFA